MTDYTGIAAKLAQKELGPNQSHLVQWIIHDMNPDYIDNVENLFSDPKEDIKREGWSIQWDDYERSWLGVDIGDEDPILLDEADDIDEAWEQLVEELGYESEPKDVMEWWYVASDRMKKDLQAIGAVLFTHPETDDVWWGRTETGQALSEDGDLQTVARQLEERVANM